MRFCECFSRFRWYSIGRRVTVTMVLDGQFVVDGPSHKGIGYLLKLVLESPPGNGAGSFARWPCFQPIADRRNGLLARAATRRWPSALVVGLGEGETYMILRMKWANRIVCRVKQVVVRKYHAVSSTACCNPLGRLTTLILWIGHTISVAVECKWPAVSGAGALYLYGS
jgi:hypothetical protein